MTHEVYYLACINRMITILKKLIENAKHQNIRTNSLEAFACMHFSSSIKDNSLDTINNDALLTYFKTIINATNEAIGDRDGLINAQAIALTREALDDLIFFNDLYKNYSVQSLFAEVKKRCGDKGFCYLPNNSPPNIIIKITKQDATSYIVSLLSAQKSNNDNPISNDKIEKNKSDYQILTYCLDTNPKSCEEFFTKLFISLSGATSINASLNYIQLLLKEYGKERKANPEPNRLVTIRPSSSPYLTNLCLVIKDTLLTDAKLPALAVKRYEFFYKLSSIVHHYAHLENFLPKESRESQEKRLQLIDLAVQELYVRLQKIYPDGLDDAELNEISMYADTVNVELTSYKKALLGRYSRKILHPPMIGYNSIKNIPNPRADVQTESPSKKRKIDSFNPPEMYLACEVSTALKNTIDYFLDSHDPINLPWGLKQVMRALPKPTGDDVDPFWDSVPIEDLSPIIDSFAILNYRASFRGMTPNDCLEIALIAYDICAQIAPRIPKLNLGTNFCLGLDNTFSNQAGLFDSAYFVRISEVLTRFQQRAKTKTPLFNNTISNKEAIQSYLMSLLDEKARIEIKEKYNEEAEKYYESKITTKELPADYYLSIFLTTTVPNSRITINLIPYLPKTIFTIRELSGYVHQCPTGFNYTRFSKGYYINKLHYHYELELKEQLVRRKNNEIITSDVIKYIESLLPINKFMEPSASKRAIIENLIYIPINKRFHNYGYNPIWNDSANGYLLKDYLNPNSFNDTNLSRDIDEQLKRIQVDMGSGFHKSLSWINQHIMEIISPKQTKSPEERKQFDIIFDIMYTNGGVRYALEHSPKEITLQIKNTLNYAYDYCHLLFDEGDGCYLPGYLEICNIETFYRSWAQDLNKVELLGDNFPSCQLRLQSLFTSVANSDKPAVAVTLLANLKTLSSWTELDLQYAMASRLVLAQTQESDRDDLAKNRSINQAFEVWNQCNKAIIEHLKSQNSSAQSDFINNVLTLMGQRKIVSDNCRWIMDGFYVEATNNKVSLDLKTGIMLVNNDELTNISSSISPDEENRKLLRNLGIDIKNLQFSRIEHSKAIELGCSIQAIHRNKEIFYLHDNTQPVNETNYNQGFNSGKIKILKQYFNINDIPCLWSLDIPQKDFNTSNSTFSPYSDKVKNSPNPVTVIKWTDQVNKRTLVEHPFKPDKAMVCDCNENWHLLEGQRGKWYTTNQVILNGGDTTNHFCNVWGAYFKGFCDPSKLLYKGRTSWSSKGSTLILQSIFIPTLDVHFKVRSGKLYCKGQHEFYLSTQKAPLALNGLEMVLVLEKEGALGTIYNYLLPKAKFRRDHNPFYSRNPFSPDTFNGYVVLEEKGKNGQLVAKTAEGNVRLAIVFALQGDFKRAMEALEYSYSHNPNSEEIIQLILEYFECKPNTPCAYAFYCQLHIRFLEHQVKWGEDKKLLKTNIMDLLQKLEKSATINRHAYSASLSVRREGVTIVPDYLHPPKGYWDACLQKSSVKTQSGLGSIKSGNLNNDSSNSTDQLSNIKTTYKMKHCFRAHGSFDTLPPPSTQGIQQVSYLFTTGTNQDGERETIKCNALAFLNGYFVNLFQLAKSDNPEESAALEKYLFCVREESKTDNLSYASTLDAHLYILSIVQSNKKMFNTMECNKGTRNLLDQIVDTIKNTPSNKFTIPNATPKSNKTPTVLTKQKHWLEKKQAMKFSLSKVHFDAQIDCPLQEYLNQFFTIEEKTVANSNILPQFMTDSGKTPIERQIIGKFKKGFEENAVIKRKHYTIKAPDTLKKLQVALSEGLIQQESLVMDLKKRIAAFSEPFSDDKALNMIVSMVKIDRARGNRPPIDISTLMNCLLTQDIKEIERRNPVLNQEQVNNLLALAFEYALAESKVAQLQEAMVLVAEHSDASSIPAWAEQLIGETLGKTRSYSPKEYPEILVYEYTTNSMLRKGQAERIIDLMRIIEKPNNEQEYRHALLQFKAGGGKTAVIIPILAQHFSRTGFMPLIFNTSELYAIAEQEIPEKLKNSLYLNTEVINRELDFKWSDTTCIALLDDLKKWHAQKKTVLTKASTWHSINLAYKMAQDEDNHTLAKAAKNVLDFLKTQCIKLEDEGQLISDPLKEYICTDTPSQTFAPSEMDLILEFYHCLMGNIEVGENLAELSGIKNYSSKVVNSMELERIQVALANQICKHPTLSSCDTIKLKRYLLSKDKIRPDWLLSIEKNQPKLANNIILASSFIKTHLPHILNLQFNKDYGSSIYEGDFTAAPKHDGIDVSSHFADPLLLLALTAQMTFQQGVPADVAEQIFKRLQAQHIQQARTFSLFTEAAVQILKLLPENYHSYSVGLLNAEKLAKDKNVRCSRFFIDYFLKNYAFRQIKVPTKIYVSDAAAFQQGFNKSISFSATPGAEQAYPPQLRPENMLFDYASEAEVVLTLLDSKNNQSIRIQDVSSPEDFFRELKKTNSKLFNGITALIDRGALLSAYEIDQISNALKNILDEERENATTLFFAGEGMRLEGSKLKSLTIKGTRILEALHERGIKLEEILIFLFLDLAHTTGTNIHRNIKETAALSIGKDQTLSGTIQAAMRERQLLSKDAQSIVWVLFQSLYEQINPKNPAFDLNQVFLWMVRNQARHDERKILMRAYQGLNQLIYAYAMQQIVLQSLTVQDIKNTFSKNTKLSIKDLYELSSTMNNTGDVLRAYVTTLCTQYKVVEKRFPLQLTEQITHIINDTARLIPTTLSSHNTDLSTESIREMEQVTQLEVEQEKEQEKEQELTRQNFQNNSSEGITMVETYNESDRLEIIFANKNTDYKKLILSGCQSIKVPEVLLNYKHFTPYPQKNYNTIYALKPIENLVIRLTNGGKYQFLACSLAGAAIFREELMNQGTHTNAPAYIMVDNKDAILCKSHNTTDAMISTCMASDSYKDVISYIEVINGTIVNTLRTSEWIRRYKISKIQYYMLVGAIQKAHVSYSPVDLMNLSCFEGLCGWEEFDPLGLKYLKNIPKPFFKEGRDSKPGINQCFDNIPNHIDQQFTTLFNKT